MIAAYARGARTKGVRIEEGVRVESLRIEHQQVKGIHTPEHSIQCEVVVNCAGLWARELGLANGIDIPVYPVEDRYVLIEPIEGTYADMPTFRDLDGSIYGREEVGGLLLGCFDKEALTCPPSSLPAHFSFDLLNENWEQFAPYMEVGIHRFPALETAGIKTFLNGPESFTPDCMFIMDEAPGVKGDFVLAGLCGLGIARSGGLGQALARWVVHGDAGIDVSQFTLKRFVAEQNTETYLRNTIPKVPSARFTGMRTE